MMFHCMMMMTKIIIIIIIERERLVGLLTKSFTLSYVSSPFYKYPTHSDI
jgi:hypothetical protein